MEPITMLFVVVGVFWTVTKVYILFEKYINNGGVHNAKNHN